MSAPMAITVMGGLTFSTVLTLFLIPVLYEAVDRKVIVAEDSMTLSAEAAEHELEDSWHPAPPRQQQEP